MHAGLSEIFIELDELDRAEGHLQVSSTLGEQAGLPQHPYRWRLATARLQLARGEFDAALMLLDEAERVYNTDFSPAIRPIAAVKARVHLARGDVDAAVQWVAARHLGTDDELTYVREYEHVTLARTLLAESGRRPPGDATVGLLERLLAAAEHGGRVGTVIEVLTLLTVAYDARGDGPAATAALDRALGLAEPEGYYRVFVDAGPGLLAVLRSRPSSEPVGALAGRLLATIEPITRTPTPRGTLVDELSSRELDVLRLLRSDLSGPEIARELHVSLNTLRTHTKSIYTKLGATNRREAIRLASEHGL
jgi:LuxR family maltose regulon positive regulatory protein